MIPFSKYSGAGNDFVVVEAGAAGLDDPAALARDLCPRSTGVGVDGMVLVGPLDDRGLRVRFFNPDGSEFATCGNGSRCAARWADDAGLTRDGRIRLLTDEGEVEARVRDRSVTLGYAIEAWIEGRRAVPLGGERRTGWLVRMGTPHLVIPLEELPDGPIEELCRPARGHASLGPEGANVNLVAPAGRDRARIRTYERGVEAETRACGAGSMAAVLALHAADRCGPEVSLSTRSGRELRVALEAGEAPPDEPAVRRIRLSGPARFVFRGRYPRRGSRRRDPDAPDAPAPGGETGGGAAHGGGGDG